MENIEELLGDKTPARSVKPLSGGERADGAFDASKRYDKALSLWRPPIVSPDAAFLPDQETINGRTDDTCRNDGYIQGAIKIRKDNIVGAQYLLSARPSSLALFGKVDSVWEAEYQEEVEEKFELLADSSDNWLDASRQNNFTEMVRLAVGIHMRRGECLSSVEWLKKGARPCNTAINFIALDRLSTAPSSVGDASVRAGIRFDQYGAPLAYQIRDGNPYDFGYGLGLNYPSYTWKEIPIRKPWGRLQMMHIMEKDDARQTRGVPEMVAALKEMRITKDFRDITLQRAVVQAMYAAAITSDLPTDQLFTQLGAQSGGSFSQEQAQEAIENFAQGFLGACAQYAGVRTNGVRVPHLFPGTKFELLTPSPGQDRGADFEQSLLRYIAATLGVSYEQLSRDYTNTNYSSARAAMSETWKFMRSVKKTIADRFASQVFRLWLEEMVNKGQITSLPTAARRAGWLYEAPLRLDALARSEWIGASRGQIDELKETQAAVMRIQNGLSTAEDELARLGKDWRKVYRQIAREDAMRKELNITFATPMALGNPTTPEAEAP